MLRILDMIRLRVAGLIGRRVAELPAISLFSGAGGLDLGVEAAGYSVRVAVELDRDACETLRTNSRAYTAGAGYFSDLTVLERDIRTLPTGEILEAAGSIGLTSSTWSPRASTRSPASGRFGSGGRTSW